MNMNDEVSTRVFNTFDGDIISDITEDDIQTYKYTDCEEQIRDEYSGMHPKVAMMLRRPRIDSGSERWKNKRKCMITATNVASILKKSPWQSRQMLFKRKTGQKEPVAKNFAMNHGIFYEPEALRVFAMVTGIDIYQGSMGLLEHRDFDWIGATPDGVCMFYPWLLEIKCPQRLPLKHDCPEYYYTQIQLQLEVCDMDRCYLVQYSPPNLPLSKGSIDILRVDRDRDWWVETLPALSQFWNEVLEFYANLGKEVGSQTVDWEQHKLEQKRKRKERGARCSLVRTPNRVPQITSGDEKIVCLD